MHGRTGGAYLADRTYLFKLAAYRELFERRIGGEHDGEYINLDFAYLKELASVDRTLRYTLLPLTLDVEHFARVELMREATAHENEDGYAIVSDYMGSLNHNERRRREGEINSPQGDEQEEGGGGHSQARIRHAERAREPLRQRCGQIVLRIPDGTV